MKSKEQYLQIRVTAEQKAAIKEAGARAGLDMSAWVLSRLLPARRQAFQGIVAALAADPARKSYALAELNDLLANAGPLELRQAVADRPAAELEPYIANYVAAMVETAAQRNNVPPPAWTAEVPVLREPVFGTPLPGLRLHLLLRSPPAFRRRNIFIDATIGSRV